MKVRLSAAAAVLAAILALAGCSSSSKHTSGTETRASAGGGGSSNSTEANSGTAKKVDVCALISAATAAKLSGQPFTKAVSVAAEGFDSRCAYNDEASTTEGVNIAVGSQNVDNTWRLVHTGNITDISGLGDKAFWDNDNTLYAVSGSMLIQVNGLDSQDKSEALARALLDALH